MLELDLILQKLQEISEADGQAGLAAQIGRAVLQVFQARFKRQPVKVKIGRSMSGIPIGWYSVFIVDPWPRPQSKEGRASVVKSSSLSAAIGYRFVAPRFQLAAGDICPTSDDDKEEALIAAQGLLLQSVRRTAKSLKTVHEIGTGSLPVLHLMFGCLVQYACSTV